MHKKLVKFTENIINDDDLSHLTVRDLRNVVIALQSADEDHDEEEDEVDESRFVI